MQPAVVFSIPQDVVSACDKIHAHDNNPPVAGISVIYPKKNINKK
jgi:hypothetical protein